MKLFVNLGLSLINDDGSGILAEAREHFREHTDVYVLAMEDDRLLQEVDLPSGVSILDVSKEGVPSGNLPPVENEDVFVLNGGITPQQAAMFLHLTSGGTVGRLVNLQRDEIVEIQKRKEV